MDADYEPLIIDAASTLEEVRQIMLQVEKAEILMILSIAGAGVEHSDCPDSSAANAICSSRIPTATGGRPGVPGKRDIQAGGEGKVRSPVDGLVQGLRPVDAALR